MKTFEERYTAWIDGQLEGSALTAFEQELARRSAAGEAEADRSDALRLRHLLRDHLEAPTLNNPDFFSHQLRERINAERASGVRRADGPAARKGIFALFPWSLARVAGLGAACLFVAGALYYGLEPGATPQTGGNVAETKPAAPGLPAQPAPQVVDNHAPAALPAPGQPDSELLVKRSPTPAPFYDAEPVDAAPEDLRVRGTSNASATGLLYQKPNVNVLWTNGLDYLPDLPAASPAPGVPSPTPAASVVP